MRFDRPLSTGKERDEETGYGYFGARYMDHELMTMWLSVDPMADKYPSMSPYAYCAWNPMKLVDPDGREIVIIGRKGKLLTYTPNMSTKGLDRFSKGVIGALNAIYKTDIGKELIDDLCGSSNTYYIQKTKGDCGFKEDNTKKAYKKQLLTDPDYAVNNNSFDNTIFEGGSGGKIRWNPAGSILPTTDGGKINAITDLAHEMFHAMDANHGLLDDRNEKGVKRSEWQAVYKENILRKQLNSPLRTHYGIIQNSQGEFIGGDGPSMLNNNLEPIKPWWL